MESKSVAEIAPPVNSVKLEDLIINELEEIEMHPPELEA